MTFHTRTQKTLMRLVIQSNCLKCHLQFGSTFRFCLFLSEIFWAISSATLSAFSFRRICHFTPCPVRRIVRHESVAHVVSGGVCRRSSALPSYKISFCSVSKLPAVSAFILVEQLDRTKQKKTKIVNNSRN